MVVDMGSPHYNYEVVKKLVQVSLDGTVYDRERASSLIVDLGKRGYIRCVEMVLMCCWCLCGREAGGAAIV